MASQLSWSSIAPLSLRSRVGIPLKPWYFSGFQLIKLENLLRWSLFTFIYNRSTKYEFHIHFTSFHWTGSYEKQIDLAPMCGFTAQLIEHRRVHGFESRWSPLRSYSLTFEKRTSFKLKCSCRWAETNLAKSSQGILSLVKIEKIAQEILYEPGSVNAIAKNLSWKRF